MASTPPGPHPEAGDPPDLAPPPPRDSPEHLPWFRRMVLDILGSHRLTSTEAVVDRLPRDRRYVVLRFLHSLLNRPPLDSPGAAWGDIRDILLALVDDLGWTVADPYAVAVALSAEEDYPHSALDLDA